MQSQSTEVKNIRHLSELGSPHGRYLATIAIVDAIAAYSDSHGGTWYHYSPQYIRRRRASAMLHRD